MNNTYILLARSLLDSEVFASQKMLKIWVWCLLKANYKDRKIPLKVGRGERTITVKRGQFLFGRFKAEEELYIDGSTIYKIIKKLEELGNIKIESSSQYSIISICNYETYQDPNSYKVTAEEQPSNKQVTTKEQPSNTTNKDNKDNKDKIEEAIDFYKNEAKEYGNENYSAMVRYMLKDNAFNEPLEKCLLMNNRIDRNNFDRIYQRAIENKKRITDTLNALENDQRKKRPKAQYTHLAATIMNWINRT